MMSLEKHPHQPAGQVWWVRQTLIMFTQWNSWLSVPSSSTVCIHGSRYWTDGTEGTKNLWAWTGCHMIFDLYVGTYNVRTLSSDDKILDLEVELSRIKWTITGLSEVLVEKQRLHYTKQHWPYHVLLRWQQMPVWSWFCSQQIHSMKCHETLNVNQTE